VKPFVETFGSFCDWQSKACKKKYHVCWSETQTLQTNILRAADSLVMNPSVLDDVLKYNLLNPFPHSIRECRDFGQSSGTRKDWRRTTNIAFSEKRGSRK